MSTEGSDPGPAGVVAAPAKGDRTRAPQAAEVVPHLSVAERAARGRAARREVPRSSHADFSPAPHRPDPVELLESQAASRVPELVPIRYGRMLVSPFTFYRGAALIMAADLASSPTSGLHAQLCGDAHLSNFGVFASPDRRLVFDLNDFDETLPGPWEWDVKRLAVSMEVAGRDNGYSDIERRSILLETVAGYRNAMREFAGKGALDVWYARLEVDELVTQLRAQFKKAQLKRTEKTLAKARTKDSMTAFSKLTRMVDGEPQIVADPPLIERVEELGRRHGSGGGAGEPARASAPLPAVASDRSADPAGGVPAGRPRPQGGGGRKRRHPRLDRADDRPRRERSAVPAVQGGAVLGARGVHRQERVRQPRRTCGRRPAPDAGLQRHLPRLAARRGRHRRRVPRLLRSPAEGLEGLIRDRGRAPPGHGDLRPSSAAGRSPAPTPAPETGSRSPPTSAAATPSTAPSPISRSPTQTRTSETTTR